MTLSNIGFTPWGDCTFSEAIKPVDQQALIYWIHSMEWWLLVGPHPIIILCMMTSSNGTIFRVTGPLCGEFTGPGEFPAQRPVTQSFDVFFDLCLKTRLSTQPWGWWFETPPWSLWRHWSSVLPLANAVLLSIRPATTKFSQIESKC